MLEDDITAKPKKIARKDKQPKKVNIISPPVPDNPPREFDMNQPTEQEDSDEDGITLGELLKQVNKDNAELRKGTTTKQYDDGEDSENDEDEKMNEEVHKEDDQGEKTETVTEVEVLKY